VEAYDFYLRGRYFWNQLSAVTTKRAMEYYARATEHDPEYALAWSGMADAYSGSPINADQSPSRFGHAPAMPFLMRPASGPSFT